jgi:hypothetical protein
MVAFSLGLFLLPDIEDQAVEAAIAILASKRARGQQAQDD